MLEIAKKEDKKNLVKYVHEVMIKQDAYTWLSPCILPPVQNWMSVPGVALQYLWLSRIGGNVKMVQMPNLDGNMMVETQVRIHGFQINGVVKNNSFIPARYEIRLIYIPNINTYTQGSVDYITPRLTMFHKSGQGCGNTLFRGYNRRALAANTATGLPIKFTTLARKVFYLSPGQESGTIDNQTVIEDVTLDKVRFKRFSLRKYFKTPQTGYVRSGSDILTNGNYFLVFWNDLPLVSTTCSMIGDCLMQYSVKASLHPDKNPNA